MFVFSLTTLYYIFFYGKSALNKLKSSIGMGDIVMLPAIVISFSPVAFLCFFVCSILLALAIYFFLALARKNKHNTIPLAGYWAILLLFSYFGEWSGWVHIMDDNWFYLWMTI
jgi:hypothetical protein